MTELSGEACILSFTPHLVPMARGILATCYARLKEGIEPEMVDAVYETMYGEEYFVRLLGRGGYPATKAVRGSNFCDIGWHIASRRRPLRYRQSRQGGGGTGRAELQHRLRLR